MTAEISTDRRACPEAAAAPPFRSPPAERRRRTGRRRPRLVRTPSIPPGDGDGDGGAAA